MKEYSKVGNRNGKPAYRTPSNFKNKNRAISTTGFGMAFGKIVSKYK